MIAHHIAGIFLCSLTRRHQHDLVDVVRQLGNCLHTTVQRTLLAWERQVDRQQGLKIGLLLHKGDTVGALAPVLHLVRD